MHQAVQQPSVRRSWWSRLVVHPEPLVERRWVPFPDLVRIHLERTRTIEATTEPAARQAADVAYNEARRDFERAEGQIVTAYWCSEVPSAAALTVRPRWRLLRRLGWPKRLYFHRASDWSTRDEPRLASLLHECDELAVKTSEVLRGTPHRICMGLAMRGAGNVLSIVDARGGHVDPKKREDATKAEEKNLAEAHEYYRKAAIRQAQLVYVGGMVVGLFALTVFAIVALYVLDVFTNVPWGLPKATSANGATPELDVSLTQILGCATAGAFGAVVSVVSRVSGNHFSLDYEVGRLVLVGLGMFRPFLGAVFGLAVYAALVSGVLQLFEIPKDDPTKAFYFFLVIAFMSGFSERWARGVLAGVEGRTGGGDKAPGPKAT